MNRIIKILVILFAMIQIANGQIITTIAGDSVAGYNNDNIPAVTAELNTPTGVAFDAAGNIYVADFDNNRVRKITVSTGIISTIAGTGTPGYNGDTIVATSAELNHPRGVAIDTSGDVYIADAVNERIRKITASSGMISTIAGTGTAGYNGDGIAADTAKLNYPTAIALDGSGNIYIAEKLNYRVRKITISTGLISTIAGTTIGGYNGDSIAADTAELGPVTGIALDTSGNIYLSDQGNELIRKITINTGIIKSIAETPNVNEPEELYVDKSGNVYYANNGSSMIKKITSSTGIISTIAGNGTAGYSGDGILATIAELNGPIGVALDTVGNIYIADAGNSRIRKINNNTGISDISYSLNKVLVYPNPSNSILNIHLSSLEQNETLQITDVLGRKIEQQVLSEITTSLDVSKWSEGVYFYQITDNKETYRGKFIKIN